MLLEKIGLFLVYDILTMPWLPIIGISIDYGLKAKDVAKDKKISPSLVFWYAFIDKLASGILVFLGSALLVLTIIYLISNSI